MGRPAAVGHLARRFLGSLRPGGPAAADEEWVASVLGEGELALWRRMSGPDRRHAVAVARRVPEQLAGPALLHDVGKIDAGLGTLARVVATLAPRRPGGQGRIARYQRHDAIGASLLEAAGAPPLTVAWAREHHLPPDRWTVPPDAGRLLKAADDD